MNNIALHLINLPANTKFCVVLFFLHPRTKPDFVIWHLTFATRVWSL